MNDSTAFEIVSDAEVYVGSMDSVCCHATRIDERHIRVPFTARQFNQGGYDFTDICVQCLLAELARQGQTRRLLEEALAHENQTKT